MGVLGHSEDIQAPFVDVLQVLFSSRVDKTTISLSQSHTFHFFFFFAVSVHHILATAVPPGPS